ncbi:MAG TPA: outer membrane lipid asymmetry maintenance protein MlaD [Gammaproteobacteria bacterium]|nr:outer membrane lipid asymmetry maintenance protein MlaD [Gammaproteobacteria bacterium]
MKQSKTTELLVGMFVAAGLAALFVLAMQVSNLSTLSQGNSYQLKARFDNIGGLKVRSPVTAGGVRVGRVAGIEYDDQRYQAVVTLLVEDKYDHFPDDTSASIFTAGLLGEQYISLDPGGSEEYLQDGSEIEITQSALVLEKLVSKFLFSKTSEGK